MRTILRNATLIDCVEPTPKENATLVLENGRIAEILEAGEAPTADAAFAICHQRKFKVMAHATNPDAVKQTVRDLRLVFKDGHLVSGERGGIPS